MAATISILTGETRSTSAMDILTDSASAIVSDGLIMIISMILSCGITDIMDMATVMVCMTTATILTGCRTQGGRITHIMAVTADTTVATIPGITAITSMVFPMEEEKGRAHSHRGGTQEQA